jgi:uncharacterized repeat protein (TIGR01451 family)
MRPLVRLYLALCWGLLLAGGAITPVLGQAPGQSQLSLTKEVDRSTAQPGDVLTYMLRAFNTGGARATGVAISDLLPQNTTFVEATGGGVLFGDTVFWSPGELGPGQTGAVTLRVRVNAGVAPGTTITNQAQISSVETPVGVPSNSVSVTIATTPTTPPATQLAVTKAVDVASAAPGGTLNYQITVTNGGATPATGVFLTDPIPQGAIGVTASDGGVIANGIAAWNLGLLAPGAARQVGLRVQVNNTASGTITNTAQVTSAGSATPVASNSVSVTVNAGPALTVNKTVDRQTAAPGEILTYTLTVTNTGGTVTGAALFDVIPTGTQFVQASNNGVLSGETVVWSFDNLAAGTGAAVSFRARVLEDTVAGTPISNQAQLAIPAQGSVLTSNTVTTTVAPPNAQLTLAKTADRTTARPGDLVTYTLTYTNVGTTVANNVAILDPLAVGLNFIDASGNVQIDVANRTLRFNLGSLAPGASGAVGFRARVDASVPAGTGLNNEARIMAPSLAQPVVSNTVVVGVTAASLAGTYKLLENAPYPSSITVDPQGRFTVVSRPAPTAPNLSSQGVLRADGSFDVFSASGRIRFSGRIDPASGAATLNVQGDGITPYAVRMPKTPDFSQLPETLVGTFVGFATNRQGDRIRVLMTIDPGGNATFEADLVQLFPSFLRDRAGAYQVTPDGQVGFGGDLDGILLRAGTSLVLVYEYTAQEYQSIFQIPLVRR